MDYYKNKVAWITGASSGIGEAFAYELSRLGVKLILSSRRQEVLERVKGQCEGSSDNIKLLPLDLSNIEELSAKVNEAYGFWNQIDFFFCNGGVSQRSLAAETDFRVTQKVMNINFMGAAAITQQLLPIMIEQKSGHIIVTSSVTGKFGTRLRSTYAASKHALHGYFDSIRQEVAEHGIKVSIICPGYIKTDVTLNALTGDGTQYGVMGDGQENGLEPLELARKALKRIAKGHGEIYIGGKEILGIFLKRLSPTFFYWLIRRLQVT